MFVREGRGKNSVLVLRNHRRKVFKVLEKISVSEMKLWQRQWNRRNENERKTRMRSLECQRPN